MIPDWLAARLKSPPMTGAGVHGWLFSVARHLHTHMGIDELTATLTAAVAGCGRRVSAREIRDAVVNSFDVRWQWGEAGAGTGVLHVPQTSPVAGSPGTGSSSMPPHDIARRPGCIAAGRRKGVRDVADLWTRSELILDGSLKAGDYLDMLFPSDCMLCVALAHPADAVTRHRSKMSGTEGRNAFVVPSPMTSAQGKRQDGQPSRRCLDNTGPRRWLVVEFDCGTADEQASLHWSLDMESRGVGHWPRLNMVVGSGGKSLHGWYGPIDSEDDAHGFFCFARWQYGADPATWNRCQLVRMPEGTRDNGRLQPVYYFTKCKPQTNSQTPSPSSSSPPGYAEA